MHSMSLINKKNLGDLAIFSPAAYPSLIFKYLQKNMTVNLDSGLSCVE